MQHLGNFFSSKFKTSTIKAGGDGCSIVDGKRCCSPICEMCGYFGNIHHTYPSLFRQYTTYVPPSLQAAIIAIYNVPPGCYYWNILTKRPVMCAKFMCHQRGVRLWHCKECTEIECQCAKLHNNIAMCQLCQCKPVWKHYHWPHMQGYAMWL